MPSFADSIFIFVLALIIFGPKKLPQLARQLGRLMAEFRRASNEFRMQMEDELRVEEQREHQRKVDQMVAAAPASANVPVTDPPHPHLPAAAEDTASAEAPATASPEVLPIAESGSIRVMPPATGLPVESAGFGSGRAAAVPVNAEPAAPAETTFGSASEDPGFAPEVDKGEAASHA